MVDPKTVANAIFQALEKAHQRDLAHAAAIDALPKPSSMRWCVSAAGTRGSRFWVKSVKWADGTGWSVKSATFTAKRIEAACLLPECALAVAKQMTNLVDIRLEKP